MNGPGDQLLTDARFAENQDTRVGGRNQVDLFENFLESVAAADHSPKGVGRANLVPQVFILQFELRLEGFDFLERTGVGNRDGRTVGEGAQPGETLDRWSPPARRRPARPKTSSRKIKGWPEKDWTPSRCSQSSRANHSASSAVFDSLRDSPFCPIHPIRRMPSGKRR